MSDQQCGSVHTTPIGAIADRVARLLLEFARPRAVTMDPEGRVWVEPVDHAAECDLVGVYQRDAGLLGMTRAISEDLRWEKERRGLVPRGRRVVTGARRAA